VSKDKIDDILSELGVNSGSSRGRSQPEPEENPKNPKHSLDRNAGSFGGIPAVPSGQGEVVLDDPAGKGHSPDQGSSVGGTYFNVYTPEAGLVHHATAAGDICELLISKGVVTAENVTAARNVIKQSPGKAITSVLVDQGASEAAVQQCVAEIAGVPFERIDIAAGLEGGVDGEMLQRLGGDFCLHRGVIPLRMDGSRAVVGTTNPDDVFLLDEVKSKLGVGSIKLVLVCAGEIKEMVSSVSEGEAEEVDITEILAGVDESDVELAEADNGAEDLDMEARAGESPVIRYVNYIIQTAVKEGASDIHIEPGDKKLKVRFRIDGILFEMMNPPAGMSAAIASRLKIMGNLDISERRVPQDGRIRCQVAGRKLDLRMSTLPSGYGEKIVCRILDTRSINVDLEDLGFESDTLEIWRHQIGAPHGIVLVTGPTGSGKTTTLYSSMRQLDKNKLNITTVEDPIEYHLEGVTQTQTHEKIGMTFGRALKALLRQDPDIIMLGEIRDMETAHIAVQAALTGHLVLSTLHTNDAPSSVTRLVNIGLEPFLVGAAINAVLAQRLVRRLCSVCACEEKPSDEMGEYLELQGMPAETMWVPKGCDKCRNTGYSGRVGIYELLAVDDSVRDIIARNPNVSEFRRLCLERGMVSLRADGMKKALKGQTSIQEILRVTESAH
jgi:type IV pilus assembly protein PilB